MNVYDCANELAKAMRESQEYKKLKEAKAALEQDPKGKEEIELAKYQGQEVPEEKNEKLQKLTGILGLNTVAMEYLHAFMRFQMMMGDISKSIGDVVKEVAGE